MGGGGGSCIIMGKAWGKFSGLGGKLPLRPHPLDVIPDSENTLMVVVVASISPLTKP